MDDTDQSSNGVGPTNQPNSFPQPTAGPVGFDPSQTPVGQPQEPVIKTPDLNDDPTKQAIYTPEAPEINNQTEVLRSQNPYLAHPYFSNQPTKTFNNDVGDIIINNGSSRTRKSNRKPWIIGGVVLALFIVIIVVILAITSKAGTNNLNSSSSDYAEARDNFNQYANMILYGEGGTTLSGEYSEFKVYKLDEVLSQVPQDETQNDNFWSYASDSLTLSLSYLALADQNDDMTSAMDIIRTQQDALAFLSAYYYRVSNITMDTIIQRYIASGANATYTYIDQTYNIPDSELTNRGIKIYFQAKVNEYRLLVDLLQELNNRGCVQRGELVEACVDQALESDSALNDKYTEIESTDTSLQESVSQTARQLESASFQISADLQSLLTKYDRKEND